MATDPLESSYPLQTAARYRLGAIGFHWVMFVLVVIVGVLGLLHDSWPKQTQAFWINIHAMFGLILWVLLFVRLIWRIRHPPPTLPQELGKYSLRLSGPMHLALYGLMFTIPIIGTVTFIWHGRVFDFGLFQLNPGVHSNRAVFHPTENIHGYLSYTLFALAGAHASAALWHHFVRRDGVLRNMVSGKVG